jgi:Fic family protein
LEARNGLLQYDEVIRLVDDSRGRLSLGPETIKRLHFFAIDGIYCCAGQFREWPVAIKGSLHKPPEHRFVGALVDEMCELANDTSDWSPIRTAAYLLWRLNWIHPFAGGNGRTSRAIAYLALCVGLGFRAY